MDCVVSWFEKRCICIFTTLKSIILTWSYVCGLDILKSSRISMIFYPRLQCWSSTRKVVNSIHGHFGIKLNKTNNNCFFPINCLDYEVNISGILGGDTLEYHDKCWLAWWRTRDVQWSQRSDTIVLMTSTNGWEQFDVMSTTICIIILY